MVVLTPAEELGLSGMSLEGRIRKAFYAFSPDTVARLYERMQAESARRRLVYLRAGQEETIPVLMRPIAMMPDQLAYLHYVSLSIINALKRLPDLYLQDFSVRQTVPLSPGEEKWLWECWGPSHRENNPVIGRLDAVVEFTSPMWKDSLRFMEPNLSCVGGIHLGPTCEQLLADVVLPELQRLDPGIEMEVGQDFREVFIQELFDHLQAVGHGGQNLCFLELSAGGEGLDEPNSLAEYFRERHGLNVFQAEPHELTIDQGEVWCRGQRIDIAYRDYEVRDLVALEAQGVDVSPLRLLFRQNRIVSSMAGDFDHKSCWELLTDAQFTQKYFNAEERQIFRRHVLWTRVLAERRTTLPDGDTGDLVPFARKHQEILVLKPNRSYGGNQIVIGHLVEPAEWERQLDAALADRELWVVQRLASLPVHEFPVVGADRDAHVEPFYTVMGFAPTKYGLAIMGRASQKQVVNVAQRGGMCGVLVGRVAGRLLGPGGRA